MGYKPTQKKPVDPGTLKPFEFQEFVQLFPDAALTKAKIKRSAFVAVSMMLSRHGKFETGLRVRPSVGTLADESGVSKPTVRKVLAYLRDLGAIVKTGEHRNPGGGSPVTEYRLYRSPLVSDVLQNVRDRDYGRGKQETTGEGTGESGEPLSVNQGTTEWKAENHNRNHKRRKESSVEESPSPAPVVATPSARDGAAMDQEEDFDVDAFLDGLVLDL
ncbi:hypothetical protein [Microbacterium alcoholitolerans]|uniref:hypothetical protein n=1 Tax=unclassified Microbacterium TaxID=2609290 RepID=UPI003D162610